MKPLVSGLPFIEPGKAATPGVLIRYRKYLARQRDPDHTPEGELPVFDRAHHPNAQPRDEEDRADLTLAAQHYHLRRTERDKARPKTIVTRLLLGDPAPSRSAQTNLEQRSGAVVREMAENKKPVSDIAAATGLAVPTINAILGRGAGTRHH